MEEIIKKLIDSEVLSEETKQDLQESWDQAVKEKIAQLTEQVTLDVRSELSAQWVKERDVIVEKLDEFIAEQMSTEFNELRSDIESFRDLEAEYAARLVEEKNKLAEEMETELDKLVDKLDEFFELRIADEIEELAEDLKIAKENEFGRKIFEQFASEYSKSFVDEDSVVAKLAIAEAKLEEMNKQLSESVVKEQALIREQKMEELLKPLSGAKREQMQFVLQNVQTAKLDEAFNRFIGRVLAEEARPTKSIVAESVDDAVTVVVTGDKTVVTEAQTKNSDVDAEILRMKHLAGTA